MSSMERNILVNKIVEHAQWWHAEVNRTRSNAYSVALEEFETPLFHAVSELIAHDSPQPFVPCAHCGDPSRKGLCGKCFIAGHRGVTCDQYCKV